MGALIVSRSSSRAATARDPGPALFSILSNTSLDRPNIHFQRLFKPPIARPLNPEGGTQILCRRRDYERRSISRASKAVFGPLHLRLHLHLQPVPAPPPLKSRGHAATMTTSSPAPRVSRYPRANAPSSSPANSSAADFLSPERNSEQSHKDALAAAAAEHERIRAKA